MQKRGELSKLAIVILISGLIISLSVVIFFVVKNLNNIEKGNVLVENLDLKISQVKQVDNKTLNVTVKRNFGEGEFDSLSFLVDDGSTIEVVKKSSFMKENETQVFSLKFILINASRIKKISITPIFIKGNDEEIIGDVEDEYVTPNTCSNYCPSGAQCGVNDCGMNCGSGCSSGYLCLNYKCIKQQSSSGSGGGSSGGSSEENEDGDETNEDENKTSCTPVNCNDLERTCGTASDECEGTLNCGNCEDGYSCGMNGLCYNSLTIEEADYYVAPWGNDFWIGNFTHPWKTWSKAFHTADTGDLVYFRGGTYYTEVTNGHGIVYDPEQGLGNDGTAENPIRYFNYPGEEPLLDCSNALVDDNDVFHRGISFYNLEYVHIKGLKLKSVHEDTEGNEYNGQKDICYGIDLKKNYHIILENIEVYDVHGIGFVLGDDYYAEIINCDSHDNADIYSDAPGDYGMGFDCGSSESFTEGYTYFYGCRAWNNSDQGFASPTYSRVVFDNCWSFENDLLNFARGDGHGWKIGYWYNPQTVNDATITIKNCISANNIGDGMAGNEHGFAYTSPYHLYNNFIYSNGRFGISINNITNNLSSNQDELRRILRNNIVYASGFIAGGQVINVNAEGLYTHSNNSWDIDVDVTDEDFVSLDVSQLYKSRKADGSLPDITFGKLKIGSDLIDEGMIIDGYHCATAGVHLGEDCVEWYGAAPDLGTFESNY